MEMNELKKVYIKNRTCYYFDDIIKMKNFGFRNVLMDQKSYENNFIYKISYETLIGANPLHIRFDKVDRFIRVHGWTRYTLVLFILEKFDTIYNRIRYFIILKTVLHIPIIDIYDSLTLPKTLTLHNVVIFIKSVLNKDQNHYYYNIFLEKCSCQVTKKEWQKSFDSIIMLRFRKTGVAKEECYGAKKQ